MNPEEENLVSQLLQMSRDKIAEGNGQEALSAVIHAIMATSGEASVMRILEAANRKATKERETEIRAIMQKRCEDLVNQDTLLAEMGVEDILIDAFQDGSSVICSRCNALVSVERAEAHSKFWCEAIETTEEDSDENDDV